MVFTITDEHLPSYIVNKPLWMKQKWIGLFNDIFLEEGEEMAYIVANSWLKRELEKLARELVRTDNTVLRIPLELQKDRDVIVRSEGGMEVVSFKLADTLMDEFGVQLKPEILKQWAARINSGEMFLGDIDHKTYNEAASAPLTDEQFDSIVKNKPNGIAKTIQAVFDKGRLWVKAVIDKRYKKLINKSKGVSMEAVVKRNPLTSEIVDADLLGFTFGVNDNPIIKGTEVYMHAS